RAKDDTPNLRRAILQREVQMSRVPDTAVRELALDPDLEERLFEEIANANGQFGDGKNASGLDGGGWRRGGLGSRFGLLLGLLVQREIEQIGHRRDPRAPAVRRRSG